MPKKGYKQTEEHKAKLRAYRHTDEAKRKIAESKRGDKNPKWKGDQVGYMAIHNWMRENYPYTHCCEKCLRSVSKTEYANLSGEYHRDRSDWLELCVSCHRTMDWDNNPHKGFKLSAEDVVEIKRLREQGLKQKEIAEMFNVVPSMISLILSGKRRQT